MSARKKIFLVTMGLIALFLLGGVMKHHRAKNRLEGFKKELAAKGAVLSVAGEKPTTTIQENGAREFDAAVLGLEQIPPLIYPEPGKWIAPGAARVTYSEEEIISTPPGTPKTNPWPALTISLQANREILRRAREAVALPGLHFETVSNTRGTGVQLRKIVPFQQWLAVEMQLALRAGNHDAAIQSLESSIRFFQVYSGRPASRFYLIRAWTLLYAYHATWEALHYPHWTDEHLQRIQTNWMATEFLISANEAILSTRARCDEMYEAARESTSIAQRPRRGMRRTGWAEFQEIVDEPAESVRETLRRLAYRYPGYYFWKWWWSYDDQIYQYKHLNSGLDAVRTLQETRSYGRAAAPLLPMETELMSLQEDPHFMFSRQSNPHGTNFLGHVALAQTLKELTVTAIAIKRFHLRHSRYPSELAELVPAWLSALPQDFLGSGPLTYRPQDAGGFLLYSVGMNGRDEGGNGELPESTPQKARQAWPGQAKDLVWPRPATRLELDTFEKEQLGTP